MPAFLPSPRITNDSNPRLSSAAWSCVEHDRGALEVLEVRGGGATRNWCFVWPHRIVVQALCDGVTFACDDRTEALPASTVLTIEPFGARTKIEVAPGSAFRALFEVPAVDDAAPSRARLHAPRLGPVLSPDAASETFRAAVELADDVLCIGRIFGPVARARAYIEENVEKDFDLETLSAIAGVERTYLCHLFQRTMGLPPYRFRTHLRIARARKLLAAGVECTEVTYALGFCDQSHLTRCFKELTGTTPGAYAKECGPARKEWRTSPAAA